MLDPGGPSSCLTMAICATLAVSASGPVQVAESIFHAAALVTPWRRTFLRQRRRLSQRRQSRTALTLSSPALSIARWGTARSPDRRSRLGRSCAALGPVQAGGAASTNRKPKCQMTLDAAREEQRSSPTTLAPEGPGHPHPARGGATCCTHGLQSRAPLVQSRPAGGGGAGRRRAHKRRGPLEILPVVLQVRSPVVANLY